MLAERPYHPTWRGTGLVAHPVFKTGRAGQPPAWKVRFLRRVATGVIVRFSAFRLGRHVPAFTRNEAASGSSPGRPGVGLAEKRYVGAGGNREGNVLARSEPKRYARCCLVSERNVLPRSRPQRPSRPRHDHDTRRRSSREPERQRPQVLDQLGRLAHLEADIERSARRARPWLTSEWGSTWRRLSTPSRLPSPAAISTAPAPSERRH